MNTRSLLLGTGLTAAGVVIYLLQPANRGELRGILQDGVIELRRHGELELEELRVEGSELGHFGGDEGLVECFVESVSSGALGAGPSAGRTALAGHLLGFAAERARETGAVVALEEFRRELRSGPRSEAPRRGGT